MLINCNSCQKKFTVPDSAITVSGRLLQCGYCENKWTQYPIKENIELKAENKISSGIKKNTSSNKIKKSAKKKKREINLYSEEYLKKKHGLTIKDTSVLKDQKIKNEDMENSPNSNNNNSSIFDTFLISKKISNEFFDEKNFNYTIHHNNIHQLCLCYK